MTDNVDIINRALQTIGTRTTITAAELAAQSTNEAIQATLVYDNIRDGLLRKAPWNCGKKTANLTYITSVPGTPENTSPATNLWTPGQPQQPWAYEYQYPVDCLRPCWIIPGYYTGFTGVPITTAVTGGSPAMWTGQPSKYEVSIDSFRPVTAATVVAGGTGYVVGDRITLPIGPTDEVPIGAPVILEVATITGSAVATVTVVNQILGSATPKGGSYFLPQTGTIEQDTTDGVGTGASFTLTQGAKADQRVILTNQEFATMVYIRQVTDPNVMDPLFQDAWTSALGAALCIPLTGDKGLSDRLVEQVNSDITEARKADGNEGLTVNDVTPDFIRTRGVAYTEYYSGPYTQFDWGPMWSMY